MNTLIFIQSLFLFTGGILEQHIPSVVFARKLNLSLHPNLFKYNALFVCFIVHPGRQRYPLYKTNLNDGAIIWARRWGHIEFIKGGKVVGFCDGSQFISCEAKKLRNKTANRIQLDSREALLQLQHRKGVVPWRNDREAHWTLQSCYELSHHRAKLGRFLQE